jgi:putative transposase
VVKPAFRKKVAGYLQDRYRVSTRKAAQNSCIARATMYYKKKSDPLVQSLRIAMRDAASKRPRFG